MSHSVHDDMLFEMLKECKTLPNFLDNIFGFLHRRTDFYHIAKEQNAPVGLPDGLAEKLVKHTFLKFKPSPQDITYPAKNISVAKEEVVTAETEVHESLQEVNSTKEESSEEISFLKSECYNGSMFDNYCWSQTITDIDIIVKIPKKCTTKELEVKITSSSISVKLKDKYILEGELCSKCKANDAVWSLDSQKLSIHLDKCREIWWNCLIQTEPHLDLTKIDCSRPYNELSEEAQAVIEELQWNQERKKLGLPTSEEMAMQETLKKAWNAEGSPFSGPFDPNCVKFN